MISHISKVEYVAVRSSELYTYRNLGWYSVEKPSSRLKYFATQLLSKAVQNFTPSNMPHVADTFMTIQVLDKSIFSGAVQRYNFVDIIVVYTFNVQSSELRYTKLLCKEICYQDTVSSK